MPLDCRSLALITGASRGLGRQIAIHLSGAIGAGSVVVLVARSATGLAETAAAVSATAPHVTVLQRTYDLSAAEETGLAALVEDGLKVAGAEPLEAALIVHNAGTAGDVSRSALQLESVAEMDRYFHTNITSCIALNSAFVRLITPRVTGGHSAITVVNISSLCALKPFKSMSIYGAGKAARDNLFGAMAAEVPDLRVLSYAPGPLVTDMAQQIADTSGDSDIKQAFIAGMKDGFLECSVSTRRLMEILQADCFTSGAHVDYYDEV